MHFIRPLGPAILALMLVSTPADSQPVPVAAAPAGPTYADLADIALAAPVAAHVRITQASRLKGDRAAGVPAGKARFYVEADTLSLIRSPGSVPATLRYLIDLPLNAEGKAPKVAKKSEYLVVGSLVPSRPGELRLATPDAMIPWTPARGEQVRAILAEASQAGAAPRITGIGRAFHVPGSLPGESETQIFLQTADDRPVSLTILRRPGEVPRWAVALSEVVDDAAAPPLPNTLLWYRLACTLPAQLPRFSYGDADQGQARMIAEDYSLVKRALGACVRTRDAA